MSETNTSRVLVFSGIVLIALTGLIHLVDAPDSMTESAIKGMAFYANFAGAAVAAVGIWKNKTWGWGLGSLVAVGALVGYIISRTAGIFGIPPDVWLEPVGIASLVVEALFTGVALKAVTGFRRVGSVGRSVAEPHR